MTLSEIFDSMSWWFKLLADWRLGLVNSVGKAGYLDARKKGCPLGRL